LPAAIQSELTELNEQLKPLVPEVKQEESIIKNE
jgi:hypothetical protein